MVGDQVRREIYICVCVASNPKALPKTAELETDAQRSHVRQVYPTLTRQHVEERR